MRKVELGYQKWQLVHWKKVGLILQLGQLLFRQKSPQRSLKKPAATRQLFNKEWECISRQRCSAVCSQFSIHRMEKLTLHHIGTPSKDVLSHLLTPPHSSCTKFGDWKYVKAHWSMHLWTLKLHFFRFFGTKLMENKKKASSVYWGKRSSNGWFVSFRRFHWGRAV